MSEPQSPQRRSFTAKTVFGLLLAVVMVGAFATAGSASPRSGQLHVTKECSKFSGLPGGFCTITGSNINAIDPGMKVVYTNPAVANGVLSSDLYVDGPGNNDAYGHVDLNVDPKSPAPLYSGPLTLSGGTGRFSGFQARVAVTCTLPAGSPCAWDGPYGFTPPGHDK
jgi:hypothetical protein